MNGDTFKHTTMVVVTARKGESMMDAIERTIKTVREQEEAECRGMEDCAEENCGGRPDPRANVKNPDYRPLRNVAMRPSDEAEFSPKCDPMRFDCCPEPVKNGLNFGEALTYLKRGCRMAREGWNGNGMCLSVQFPDAHSKMTFPYMYMTIPACAEGTRLLPWQPAQVDLFSEDWMVLD